MVLFLEDGRGCGPEWQTAKEVQPYCGSGWENNNLLGTYYAVNITS